MSKLITLKEAARVLGVHYITVVKLIKSSPNYPGIYKIGKSYKLDIELFKANLTCVVAPKAINFARLRYYYENECSYYRSLSNNTEVSHRKALLVAGEYFYTNEFTKENLYRFKDYLILKKKLKEGSVKKYFNALSKMCEACVNAGILKENIALGMQRGLKTEKVERFLTKEERERIKAVAKEDILEHIEFAIETGLRKGEQFSVTWDKVDFIKGELYIVDRKNGKNLVLPISKEAINILVKRKNLSKPFRNISFYEFKEVLDMAEINNFRWHDLRHTFATWCIKGWHSWLNNKPLSLDRIQKLLGHSRITMTERYSHLDASDLKSIFDNSG